jgi:hypothetical protein
MSKFTVYRWGSLGMSLLLAPFAIVPASTCVVAWLGVVVYQVVTDQVD